MNATSEPEATDSAAAVESAARRNAIVLAAANAVIDALAPWGVTHVDIPMTPEKVWRAIQNGSKSASAAD